MFNFYNNQVCCPEAVFELPNNEMSDTEVRSGLDEDQGNQWDFPTESTTTEKVVVRNSGSVVKNEYDYSEYYDELEEAYDKENEEDDYYEYPDDLCPNDDQVCSELEQCGEEGIKPLLKISPLGT